MLWAPCCGANNQMERHQSKWKSCILPKDASFLLWSSVFIARLISFIISSLCKLVLFSRRGGGGVWINIFSLVKLLHLFEADEDAEIFTTFGHGLTFLQLCGKCIGLNTNRGLAGVGRCAPGEGLDYPCGTDSLATTDLMIHILIAHKLHLSSIQDTRYWYPAAGRSVSQLSQVSKDCS